MVLDSCCGGALLGNSGDVIVHSDLPGCPREVSTTPGGPVDVSVDIDWSQMPIGIENGLAPLGCIYDADDVLQGKVFLCKSSVDEQGAVEDWSVVAVYLDGSVVSPYSGAWADCSSVCAEVAPFGVITDLDVLGGN